MTASAKKARTALVGGTEYTDASLEAMKTGEIAPLVSSIRGGNPPKPATKAKAIELFWKAAEGLPKTPAVPDSKAEALEVTTETLGTGMADPEKAPKFKTLRDPGRRSRAGGEDRRDEPSCAAAGGGDQGRRPLSMAECSAIVGKVSKSGRPDKLVAWHFCKLYRPAGILVESRDGRGV